MAGSSRKGSPASEASMPEMESAGVNNEDYNTRSPERTELLTKIKGVINDAPISPAFWACCQLGDMNRLQIIANIGDEDIILAYEGSLATIALHWTRRFRNSGSKAGLQSSKGSKAGSQRSNDPKRRKLNPDRQSLVLWSANNCKARDGYKCTLTKQKYPEAAHIFPYSMINPSAESDKRNLFSTIPDFWSLLRLFWDRDRVTKWRNAIFSNSERPDVSVERCFNLISLSPDAHSQWTRGVFALKPLKLSHDRKRLTVQFFWQLPGKYKINDRIDLLTEPASSEGLDMIPGECFLSRFEDDGCSTRFIRSGEKFTFTTEDPEKLPLPSLELLEMQWVLQRLVGMSGAAGWPSLNLDDNDSVDDDYSVGYDDSTDDNDNWLIPDHIDRSVHDSLKRVHEWIGAEEAANTTPETSTHTPSPAMI